MFSNLLTLPGRPGLTIVLAARRFRAISRSARAFERLAERSRTPKRMVSGQKVFVQIARHRSDAKWRALGRRATQRVAPLSTLVALQLVQSKGELIGKRVAGSCRLKTKSGQIMGVSATKTSEEFE